jgi:rod shape-determining protein MreB
MLGKKVALDLGTSAVRMIVKGDGTISSEPAVVSRLPAEHGAQPLFGAGALRAASEDPSVRLGRPLEGGAVRDQRLLRAMFNLLMIRAVGRQRIFKPDLVIAVMSALSGDDRRLVLDAAMQGGARTVYLIDAVMAGAIGAGMPITSSRGHLAVDAGAGKTEVAVLALESTIARASLPGHGGDRLAAAVAKHVSDAHGVKMGGPQVEDLVASLLRAGPHEERTLSVTGSRDGSAASATVASTEFVPVLEDHLRPVVAAVHEVLADTPAPMIEDIRREGIVAFGGGARLEGLDRHLAAATGIRTVVDRDPLHAVIRGAGYALDNLDVLKRNLMYIR